MPEPRTNRYAELKRDALSYRCDHGQHLLDADRPLSYRHLEEMVEGRGVSIGDSSIKRWVIRFLPLIEKMARKHKCPRPRQLAHG
jgi:hypothetical protein